MYDINKIPIDNNPFLGKLQHIYKPPQSMWVAGTLPKECKTVAIIGSRKPTNYGRSVNDKITRKLVEYGVVIISGLAIGHDGMAHRACLDAGGTTVAVLGNGLNKIYPSSHQDLGKRIIKQGGALISEYPPDTPVMPYQFLERNRIISGLADIVVVIEAGEKSGTLNTVSHALEQGRDVMAVMGNIDAPLSRGCNKLIATGATPVLSADDILLKLDIDPRKKPAQKGIKFENPDAQFIYDLINRNISDEDELIALGKMPPNKVRAILTILELQGYIRSSGNNKWHTL